MKTLPFALLLALIVTATSASGCQTMRRMNTSLHDGIFGKQSAAAETGEAGAAARDGDRASAEPKKAGDPADDDAADAKKEKEPTKTLYERIGGEPAVVAIVDDLVARVSDNPSINFTRKGTPREWRATPANVAILKKRLVQFLGTATGGPQRYEGEDMRTAHRGMRIGGPEFDAFADAFEASLESANVPQKEQKELLEIIESTRGPIGEAPGTTRPNR